MPTQCLFLEWFPADQDVEWGTTFDVGNSTASAIRRLMKGVPPEEAGGRGENDNGNGSLMRILPVGISFSHQPLSEFLDTVHSASSVTHRHPRTLMACGFYCLMVRALLDGLSAEEAYLYAIDHAKTHYARLPFAEELGHFERLFSGLMGSIPETAIKSGGYVIHTLEAGIWCLLNSDSFQEATLKAVNLGEDTDTTGCVTGGHAGVLYGLRGAPKEWLNAMARREDIDKLLAHYTS
jgi:ADP-ribosyl-[dinitrogen reductase] hydrolase